jgi:hypothetical protein
MHITDYRAGKGSRHQFLTHIASFRYIDMGLGK